jgi:predicted nucleotide-binding protein
LVELVELEPDVPPNPVLSLRPETKGEYTSFTMLHSDKAFALVRLRVAMSSIPKDKSHDSESFNLWRERTLNTLKEIFGKDSPSLKRFERISFRSNVHLRASLRDIQRGVNRSEETQTTLDKEAFRAGIGKADETLRDLIEVVEAEPDVPPNPAPSSETSTPSPKSGPKTRSNKVFVVHGHDGGLKNAVARFIEKLGLDATILHERPDRGRTVIEKFEQEADVGYAVILATADDLADSAKAIASSTGGLSPDALNERARQNVVFELGFFVGRLGREGVTLVKDAGVELPSDYAGVVYAGRSEWQRKIYEALHDAEYEFSSQQIREALAISE